MQNFLAGLLSSPLFVLAVSLGVFVGLAWIVLPFALFGVRRRLDRIIEGLERIETRLGGASSDLAAPAPESEGAASTPEAASPAGSAVVEGAGLLDDFREAVRGTVPGLQERLLDARHIEYIHRRGWGREFPCMRVLLEAGRLEVRFPLRKLEEAYPRFGGEQFDQYMRTFLGEKHGVQPVSPAGEDELLVVVGSGPATARGLEIFVGIVQEQLWRAMEGEGE